MDFPRLVYKGPATHLLVENAAQHAEALKAGWHNTVPEALGHKPVAAKEAPKAEDLGQTQVTPVATGKGKKADKNAPAAPVATPDAVVAPQQKSPWD